MPSQTHGAPFHDTALPPVPLPLSDSSKPAVFRVLLHIRQRFCPESPNLRTRSANCCSTGSRQFSSNNSLIIQPPDRGFFPLTGLCFWRNTAAPQFCTACLPLHPICRAAKSSAPYIGGSVALNHICIGAAVQKCLFQLRTAARTDIIPQKIHPPRHILPGKQ